ncbi:MAG: hypothetical protein WDN45_06935 [Caulobacteraceae bacterium]
MKSLALAALLAGAALAVAQAQAPAGFVRITGTVSAISDDAITVKGDDGKSITTPLARTWTAIAARPVNIEAIKPGSFVATANTNIDAASGKSIELRVFEAGNKGGEGSRPMAAPNTTMTNATVQTVTKGPGGRELDVAFPGGTRHIIVPPDVKVIGNFAVGRDRVKPGVTVNANGAKGEDGVVRITRITVVEK